VFNADQPAGGSITVSNLTLALFNSSGQVGFTSGALQLLDLQIRANFAMEINASFFPVALRAALGQFLYGRNFGKSKTAEETQINDLGEPRVCLSKLVKGVADTCELAVINDMFEIGGSRSYFKLTTSLLGLAIAYEVDDQTADDSRRIP
jgi:hypothetical protein